MRNGVGKGAVILIISGFICKLFGAFFRLPLTNIIGVEGIGIFQMVMSIYSLMLVFLTGGVTNSLSRLVSNARARGDVDKIGSYFRISFILTLGLGLVLGLIFLIFAKFIASSQGALEAYDSYRLFIFLLPLGAVIGVFRGIIQGYENMTPTAITQIIEQVVKFAFGLLFAYYFSRRGVEHGVYGAFLGITISELIASIYLIFYGFNLKLRFTNYDVRREFLKAAIPLSLSNAVIPFTHALDSLIIVSRLALAGIGSELATSLFGLQTGVVGAILNFPLVISLSVGMSLLPKISFLIGKNDISECKKVVSSAFSVMWFFLIPLVVGIISIAGLIYPLIYPNAIKGFLQQAIDLTTIGGISVILSALMQFFLSLLQAAGYYNYTLLVTFIAGIIKLLIVLFLAPVRAINIFAIPISNISFALVVTLAALLKLGKLVKVSGVEIFLPILSSIVMYCSLTIFLKSINLTGVLALLLAVFLGGIIYFTLNIPIVSSLLKSILGKNKVQEERDE